jgi:hypothetical protein
MGIDEEKEPARGEEPSILLPCLCQCVCVCASMCVCVRMRSMCIYARVCAHAQSCM